MSAARRGRAWLVLLALWAVAAVGAAAVGAEQVEVESDGEGGAASAPSSASASAPAPDVVALNGVSALEGVYRSPRAWVVLVTATAGKCPQCGQYLNTVEEAARLSKGVARFGYVEVDAGDNGKALNLDKQASIPHVRLYLAAGQPNAYRKGHYFREFLTFPGAPSARQIKKLLQEAVSKDPPVRVLKASEAAAWRDDAARARRLPSVVALSSKEAPSPLLAALARALAGRAEVAHVVVAAEPAAEPALFGAEGIPALAARAAGEATSWAAMDPKLLAKAGVDELLAFCAKHAGVAPHEAAAGAGGEQQAQADGESEDAATKAAYERAFKRQLLRSVAQMDKDVHRSSMPAVVAARTSATAGLAPPEWEKFLKNAHGVGAHLVYCDPAAAAAGEGPEAALTREVCPSGSAAPGDWALLLYEFQPAPLGTGDDTAAAPAAKRNPRAVPDLGVAQRDALASIPDAVARLNQAGMLQGFISTAVPARLVPLVLFGKAKDPPAMLSSAAAALQGLALVAYRGQADKAEIAKEFGVPQEQISLPIMFAVMRTEAAEGAAAGPGKKGKKGEEQLQVAMYDRLRFGQFRYASMVSFALQVATGQDKARTMEWVKTNGASIGVSFGGEDEEGAAAAAAAADVAGAGTRYDDPASPMARLGGDKGAWERLCPGDADTALLCVIGALDGSPLNPNLQARTAVLEAARAKLLAEPAAARLRFVLLDATCQPELAAALGVEPGALPALAVYQPRKQALFRMLSSFSDANVEKFLRTLLSGVGKSAQHVPRVLAQRPAARDVDCAALPGRDQAAEAAAGAGAADDDADELLREIRAEEERAKKERKEQLKRERELKEKEEKSRAEAEQAAASGKKRRRRRRKAQEDKDEL